MIRLIKISLAVLAVLALVPSLANASQSSNWGPWQALPNANGVSVSFSQVNDSVCTWMIRNTGNTTLRQLEFSYTYTPAVMGKAGQMKPMTGYDLLLSPLKRGQLTGGAAQFSVETGQCPSTLVVKHIEWAH